MIILNDDASTGTSRKDMRKGVQAIMILVLVRESR